MTVCSLDKKKAHSYQDLAKVLNIKEDDVEEWTCDAITNGLIEAKVDQIAREIVILSHQFQSVGEKEWNQIQDQLRTWKSRFETI